MGADSTQPGQGHSAPRAAHRPSGKPARVPALPALLEPGEPQPPALPLPCPGRGEIPQRPVQIPERLLIGALGILTPPRQRRISLLLRIPQFVQAGARIPPALHFVALLALRQAPVPREPRRPRMRPQGTLLRHRRIQGKPVSLIHLHGASPVATATARFTRSAAALRPYSRAHKDVRISVTSRTRPPSTSDGSTTSSRRPCAESAASTYSPPNRANLSRSPTTMVVTDPSRSRARNARRLPFSAEPTSVTTRPTASPSPAAHAVTRATCRSRSDRWPAEETRAYTATSSAETGTGAASTRISRPARLAGTGSLPSRNQRYAVTGWTPCCSAHSFKFTHAFYCILTRQQLTSPQPGASGPRRKFWPKTVGTGTCGPLTREPAMTAGLWPTPQEPGGTDVRQLPPPACRSRKLRAPPLPRAPRDPGQSCCAHRPRGGPAGGRSYRRRPVGVQPGRAPPEPGPGSVRPGCRGPGPAGQFRQPVLWTACISDAHAVTRAGRQEGSPAGPVAARAR